MEPIDIVHDLLEWTDPKSVGRSGQVTSMCHDIPSEFWELWKEHKDELRAGGIRVLRDEEDGAFFATWIRGPEDDAGPRRVLRSYSIPAVTRYLKAPSQFVLQCPWLHPDQRDATWTLLQAIKEWECRFTLDASDAGIGKTWIALTLMKLLGENFGIICPANVVTKWTDTAVSHPFELEPEFILSYERLKHGTQDHLVAREDYKSRGVKKTRYHWQPTTKVRLIFDEVHYCSGTDSLNAQLLKGAIVHPDILIHSLSATIAESPLDMRAVGFGLELHDWKGWWQWCKKMGARPGHFGGLLFNTGIGKTPTTNQRSARQHLAEIHAHIFPKRGTRINIHDSEVWRPKNQVMAEIVDVEKTHPDIGPLLKSIEVKELADEEKAEEKEQLVSGLVLNTRARQRAEIYKLPYIRRRIKDLRQEGNSVIVFLNYNQSIDWLLEYVGDVCVIRGGMGDDRDKSIKAFQTNQRRVCICQNEAGGQSIDLDDVTGKFPRCVLISPTYNAKRFYQILGRGYRPATTKSMVRQWVLFAADTVEERVGRVVQVKLDAQSLINDGDLSQVVLTR